MEFSTFYPKNEQPKFSDTKQFNLVFDSIKPLYANAEITKCITENDESYYFTKSTVKILNQLVNSLNLNEPLLLFFHKIIESFHKSNVCSTKTTVLLSIILFRRCEFVKKLNELDSGKLSKYLNLIFNQMVELSKRKYLLESKNIDEKFIKSLCRNDCKISKVLNDTFKKICKFSLDFKTDNINFCYSTGNTKNRKNLIEECFNFRVKKGSYFKIDNSENFNYLHSKSIKALVFDSNLSSDFVHLGYNKELKIDKFYNQITNDLHDNKWYEQITGILIKNEIRVLILKDSLENRLAKFCNLNKILVFKYFSMIKYLKNYSLSYINDFESSKIVSLIIEFIKKESKDKDKCLNDDYVRISFPSLDNFLTLIVENKFKSTELMIIDSLKSNLRRFENIINQGYFKGAGAIEKNLARDLECLKNSTNDIYFEYARNILVESLVDLSLVIDSSSEKDDEIIDDATSKIKAWKTILFFNNFFLNCDY